MSTFLLMNPRIGENTTEFFAASAEAAAKQAYRDISQHFHQKAPALDEIFLTLKDEAGTQQTFRVKKRSDAQVSLRRYEQDKSMDRYHDALERLHEEAHNPEKREAADSLFQTLSRSQVGGDDDDDDSDSSSSSSDVVPTRKTLVAAPRIVGTCVHPHVLLNLIDHRRILLGDILALDRNYDFPDLLLTLLALNNPPLMVTRTVA